MKHLEPIKIFTAFIFTIIFIACDEPDSKSLERFAGDIVSVTQIHQYSPEEASQVLQNMGLAEIGSIPYSIQAKKITYLSPDHNQKLKELSGALIYPVDNQNHPLLSIQHGTVTKRTDVASENPLNSSAGMTALFTASQGYVTLVPDYAGFGESHDIHPYMHAESLANSVIDLIRAVKTYCLDQGIELQDQLYLTGYSEGGYATLAVQKKIESELSDEFSLTAIAPMAGPYDLSGTARHIMRSDSYHWPAYIGFMFVAYEEIYELDNLSVVFDSPYDLQIADFYNGEYDFYEINNQLPQSISELISSGFLESFNNGTEIEYSSVFEENNLLDWGPVTPTRFYHGMADSTVPYTIAVATVANLSENGPGVVELVGIPDANHATAGLPAILAMMDWFSTYHVNSSNLVNQIK
ncbi:MAG: prolyl oligopeptidase family serine peptidase [Candidatus Marinimicrobia bacterium]|nr:prolyl oligopeptidase family serine peptidase [Candidatus Neomarinimicrobiota bacterium]